jgi:6-phosphogluconolactonase
MPRPPRRALRGYRLSLLVAIMSSCTPPSPLSAPARAPGPLVAYASGYGPNIELLAVDPATGSLSRKASVPSFGPAPTYLAINQAATNLYALDESSPGRVGAYAIEPATGALTFLNDVPSGGNGPAHVALDRTDRYVLVANYGDGSVSTIPVLAGGRLGPPIQTLSVGGQAHMIIADPSNRFVFVPCKAADYVAQFVFDSATGKLTPNAIPRVSTAAGAGPRHLAFHPNGRFVYLVNELDNTLTAYAFDAAAGTLSPIETKPTLPAGFSAKDTAAEVWVHPSGAWVLASNRGDDSIVVFAIDPSTGKMTLKGHTKTGGATPRDFTLDPTGAFVYVANQGSGNLVAFRFDAAQGTLLPATPPVPVQAASFVEVLHLPAR